MAVLVFAGAFLLFLGMRKLLRIRSKHEFLKKVAEEQESADMAASSIDSVWELGEQRILDMPSGRCRLPFHLILDTTGGSPLFDSAGDTAKLGNSTTSWHFLKGSLAYAVETSGGNDWDEAVYHGIRNRSGLVINGITVILSARQLLSCSETEMRNLGSTLRLSLQHALTATGKQLPVTLLVDHLETFDGMPELSLLLSNSDRDMPLGCDFSDAVHCSGKAATDAALRDLAAGLRRSASCGAIAHGDMLSAMNAFRRIAAPLDIVCKSLSRTAEHQPTPFPSAIRFCFSLPQTGSELPPFLQDCITRMASAVPPADLPCKASFHSTPRLWLYAGYLTLLMGICGVLAAGTIYQCHILGTTETSPMADFSNNSKVSEMYNHLERILELERARKAWFLPTFGQNRLISEERRAKAAFIRDTVDNIIKPMAVDVREALTSATDNDDRALQLAEELVWMCSVAADGRDGTVSPKIGTYPLTKANEHRWNPFAGQIIINCMRWLGEEKQTGSLLQELRTLLLMSMTSRGGTLFKAYHEKVNKAIPSSQVVLSEFWPHVEPGSKTDTVVSPSFTADGYAYVKTTMQNLLDLTESADELQSQLKEYEAAYFKQYGEAWRRFIKDFADSGTRTSGKIMTDQEHPLRSITDLPHIRLILVLEKELAPLFNEPHAPAWIADFRRLATLFNIALLEGHSDRKSELSAFIGTAGNSPELLRKLRAECSTVEEMRRFLATAATLRDYLEGIMSLTSAAASEEKSLALASIHFGQRPGADAFESSAFTTAARKLKELRKLMAVDESSPVYLLLQGMQGWISRCITMQASDAVQHAWETEVLADQMVVSSPDNPDLYASGGIIGKFINEKLRPFLSTVKGGQGAASWNSFPFPFTSDFLNFVAQSREIVRTPIKDKYDVRLSTRPTIVNADALEKPDATEIRLMSDGGPQTVINRNYPTDSSFSWMPQKDEKTILNIEFPSFTLTYVYAKFSDFIEEFQYGESIFDKEDFPENSALLEKAGVKEIKVRIMPDNVHDILAMGENTAPAIPNRICKAW